MNMNKLANIVYKKFEGCENNPLIVIRKTNIRKEVVREMAQFQY